MKVMSEVQILIKLGLVYSSKPLILCFKQRQFNGNNELEWITKLWRPWVILVLTGTVPSHSPPALTPGAHSMFVLSSGLLFLHKFVL